MTNRDDIERYCSDVIKDADEYVVYTFEHEDSTDYQRMTFDDPEIAGRFKQGSSPLTSMQREIVDDLIKPSTFLDKMVEAESSSHNNKKDKTALDTVQGAVIPELVYGMTPEEFEEKFKKIKKRFKKKRQDFETKAKDALIEAARVYLGDKHIESYKKYKLELAQSGLSTVMFQVHTMHQAIDALSARMHAAGSMISTKDVEAFVGLQRIMLDVQKFQFEYMQSIETSMKELKVDLEIAENGTPQHDNSGDNIFYFKGGKDFLKQLAEMKNTMSDFIPTPSKNKMLNPNAEVIDVVHQESLDSDGKPIEVKNPFGGYENQPKRKGGRGEFDDEGGDEGDDY